MRRSAAMAAAMLSLACRARFELGAAGWSQAAAKSASERWGALESATSESLSHRFALPKLTAQIETATGLCEEITSSLDLTRYRARPRTADPGHSRYLPRRHIIAHDQKQSLHRRYHGDYIISGSRLDLDASEKRVPAPRYIRIFSSSPYTAARPPRTRATRPRTRRRENADRLAAFHALGRPRARPERGPARRLKN